MERKRYVAKKKKESGLIVKFLKVIFKTIFSIFLILLFLGFAILTFFFFYTGEVVDNNFWQSQNTMYVYDRDGDLITTYGLNVDYVTLDEVSDNFINALIATEDSKFEKHHGVDYTGMVRAVYQTLFTESSSGGSTLTMQLAKLLYLQPTSKLDDEGNVVYDKDGNPVLEYPYYNKIGYKLQQIVYSWKIEAKYSKEEILENYANFVYLAVPGNSHGIESAANYYFGVDASNLSLSQGAVLAGLVQEPQGDNNPYIDIEGATQRRNTVLDRMVIERYITQEECDEAKAEEIEETLLTHEDSDEISKAEVVGPYMDVVNLELKDLFGEDFDPVSANMNVYTNLDYELQEESYKIINNYYGTIRYPDDLMQAGSATIDSTTGEILAIGGGRNTENSSGTQNYGALYQRQPGSTAKPIVDYAPAIEFLDWSTYHQLNDKYTYYTGSKDGVKNADGTYEGTMSIQQGLAESKNTIALQTFQQTYKEVGLDTVKDFVAGLGITDLDDFNEAYSIGGWSHGTTPLELSGAYAALANGGVYNKPHAINKIEFSKSSPYYEEYGDEYVYEYETHVAMEEETAYMVTKMLNPKLSYALTNIDGLEVSGLGEQAVKTGTSNWGEEAKNYDIPEGGPRDKWVAGYNADVTTVVWSGYDGEDEKDGNYFDSLGVWSYDIYKGIMNAVVNNSGEYLHDDEIVVPDGVATRKVGGITYYYKTDSSDYSTTKKSEEKAAEEKAAEEKATEEKAAEEKAAEEKATEDDTSDEIQEVIID